MEYKLPNTLADNRNSILADMTVLSGIDLKMEALFNAGVKEIARLKNTTANQPEPEEMNLRTIPQLAQLFSVPVATVVLDACIIEKHLSRSRSISGPDSAFSKEQDEFMEMVNAVRTVEKALGGISSGPTENETIDRPLRHSLFVVDEVYQGK